MLRIYFGSLPDEIYNTEMFYENQYDRNWVIDDFASEVIREIDDSQVVAPDMIQNDIFGTFSSTELSAGVKTLLLIRNMPNKTFNISNCGDNCAKYLLQLAEARDIKVTLHHAMDFGTSFSVKVINEGKRRVVKDPIEFLMLAHHYLKGDDGSER